MPVRTEGPKRILVCPDKFRGSLTAAEAAAAMTRGLRESLQEAEVTEFPLSDGGEGFAELMARHLGGELHRRSVAGPLYDRVDGVFAVLPDGTAVVDMASASGLALLDPADRDPMLASSRGTGELILGALNQGCRGIVVGAGGSATVDGGLGAAASLGVQFLDAEGGMVDEGGKFLEQVARIDTGHLDPRLSGAELIVAADVGNTLLGPGGAAAVYGPQKGADGEQVRLLEEGLSNFARVVDGWREENAAPRIRSAWATSSGGGTEADFVRPIADIPGTGSAGGMAVALAGIAGAIIERGASLFMDMCGFDRALGSADAVVTGEGRFDTQSAFGKVVPEVVRRTSERGITTVVACGQVDEGTVQRFSGSHPGSLFFSLCGDLGLSPGKAMEDAASSLEELGALMGRRLGGTGGA